MYLHALSTFSLFLTTVDCNLYIRDKTETYTIHRNIQIFDLRINLYTYICYLKLLSDALFDSQGLIKKTERNKLAGKNVASKRFL